MPWKIPEESVTCYESDYPWTRILQDTDSNVDRLGSKFDGYASIQYSIYVVLSQFRISSELLDIGNIKMPILKISKEQFATFFVVIGLLVISVFGMYSNTRIDRYRPKTEDESQIIKLLIMFHKAKTEYHLEKYLFCLSDQGQFMYGGSIMVSKKVLKKLLPSFWSDLRSNRLNAVPSSREELNGNFLDGMFYDPVIEVTKDKAKAIITFVTPVTRWKTKLFLNFQKYNASWKITRLEWDTG